LAFGLSDFLAFGLVDLGLTDLGLADLGLADFLDLGLVDLGLLVGVSVRGFFVFGDATVEVMVLRFNGDIAKISRSCVVVQLSNIYSANSSTDIILGEDTGI